MLLDLYIGMQTQNIRVGQLGIVLPAANPLRVAEDIAMLDHMTGGRANAGFARGYQRRWVDVLGQHAHGVHGALPDQHDAIDQANRDAFEENYRLVKRAWTEEMIEGYEGKLWTIPISLHRLATARDQGDGQRRQRGWPADRHRCRAQAVAEAAPANLPAVRHIRTLHALVCGGGHCRHRAAGA